MGSQLKGVIAYFPKLFDDFAKDIPLGVRDLFVSNSIAENIASKYGPGVVETIIRMFSSLASLVNVLFALFFSYWFLKCPIDGSSLLQSIEKLSGQIIERFKSFKKDKKGTCVQIVSAFNETMTKYLPWQLAINLFEGVVGGLWLGGC